MFRLAIRWTSHGSDGRGAMLWRALEPSFGSYFSNFMQLTYPAEMHTCLIGEYGLEDYVFTPFRKQKGPPGDAFGPRIRDAGDRMRTIVKSGES